MKPSKRPCCPLGKNPLVLNDDDNWECRSCGFFCTQTEAEELELHLVAEERRQLLEATREQPMSKESVA